jgi:N-hydroxyarylamine O-acetyltransferase
MANYYTSTYPQSHFRHDLIVARTTPEARHALLRNRLTIRRADGGSERRFLSADEIERALAEVFRLPVTPDWRPVIERAAATVWEDGGNM